MSTLLVHDRRWSLPQVLRALGACLVLISGLVFLVEGWSDAGLVARSLSWGGFTLLLSVLSLVALKRFNDALGARWLLGLAAATVPLHFAVLGAGVWDAYSGETAAAVRPSSAAVLLAGGVTVALLPLLSFCLRALVRDRSRKLLALLFAFSAPLVLPYRSGAFTAMWVIGAVLALLASELAFLRTDPHLQHGEARAMRRLLFAPLAIALVRTTFHDPFDPYWQACLLAAPSLTLLCEPLRRQLNRRWANILQGSGAVGLLGSALLVTHGVAQRALAVAVAYLILAVISRANGALIGLCLFSLAVARVAGWYEAHAWFGLLCVLVALASTAVAFYGRNAAATYGAVAGSLLLIGSALARYLTLPLLHGWLVFAALGALLLIGASLFESQIARWHRLRHRWRAHFHA